jgi:predicted nucleic acid-binding protein
MREAVLDASVILKWFGRGKEKGSRAAGRLRKDFESGNLAVLVPSLLPLEVLNVAGRRWLWKLEELIELAGALDQLPVEAIDPDLGEVARWIGRGLTAYDAAYVAVAVDAGVPLVTRDAQILATATGVATALS